MMENKNRTGCAVLAFALLLAGCAQASDGDVDTSGKGKRLYRKKRMWKLPGIMRQAK
jgi:PBP1b-binding outer membrane lipoprotein LpoB